MSASTSSGLVSHDANTPAATSVVSFKHTRKPRRKKNSSNKSSPRKQVLNISYELFAENEKAGQKLYQVLVRRPTNNEMKPPQLIDDRWVIACTEHQLSRRNCDVFSISNFFTNTGLNRNRMLVVSALSFVPKTKVMITPWSS
uniref:Uncharacterized protein n=1 Tax=Cacopsylla melanoneura TaxID=428564 RepID=A0A8D8Y9T9_9HEMI